ncbi:hypothetical protein, partial [Pectobacterium aquaticum]|uniref:hypothetical protein n=1 Tax=Pectobacterium aquaticum TaxID=2204145 RepID=UPI001F0F7CC0
PVKRDEPNLRRSSSLILLIRVLSLAMATRLRKMGYQEKVLPIVLKVKSAGFRRQDHGFRRMARFGRNKSESAVELNRKVRSDYIGINGRFGSEYAITSILCTRHPLNIGLCLCLIDEVSGLNGATTGDNVDAERL